MNQLVEGLGHPVILAFVKPIVAGGYRLVNNKLEEEYQAKMEQWRAFN